MSVRLLTTRLLKHGRYFLHQYYKRDIHANILEQNKNRTRKRFSAPSATSSAVVRSTGSPTCVAKSALNIAASGNSSRAASSPSSGIFRLGQHARKLFVDNILNRVTTTYNEDLRNQTKRKLFYGDSAPFFALIGVSLASGAGVLTKEDELEGVCWEIREAANRLQNSWNHDDISETLNSSFSIDKLNIGPAIAKGCAAVVYAASFKNNEVSENSKVDTSRDAELAAEMQTAARVTNVQSQQRQQQQFRPEFISPIQNISRFVHNFGGSVDNLNIYHYQSSVAAMLGDQLEKERGVGNDADNVVHATNKEGVNTINRGISGGIQGMQPLNQPEANIQRYPLALKMMFNYDIQSNALSILRAMYKETVPARQRYMHDAAAEWERVLQNQTLILPPHPNIVCMFGFFCDEVGNFPDGHLLYPIAQPQRINPLGYGRNMSLYLLMKRYDYSLRALLDTHELSTRTKLLLFAQLLEAVAHINRHGIAHRDLKSDNILIEMNDDNSPPILVLSDFGCCLADRTHGLQLPYTSYDIDKGGNAALMAPEIINKTSGPFAVLNYEKADLWACGAIAYEIFGLQNPFYSSSGGLAAVNGEMTYSLKNSNYKADELPPLTVECPEIVQQLIYNILNPNPSKRVSPDIAANIMQLYLWAPSKWLKSGGMPNNPEILQWLLSLTTKVMCDGRLANDGNVGSSGSTSTAGLGGNITQLSFNQTGRRTYVEYLLISSFLTRVRLRRIRGALNWIQNFV